MSKETFTDTELDGLSDEERAALEDEEGDGDGADEGGKDAAAGDDAGKDKDTGDDPKDTDITDPEKDPDTVDGDKTKATDDAAAAKAKDKPEEDKDDDEQRTSSARTQPFAPMYRAEPVENFKERVATLDKQMDELDTKYEDGELTLAELRREQRKIDDERLQLHLQQQRAEMVSAQNEQTAEQRWEWEQDMFFSQEANKIYKDELYYAALNQATMTVARDPQFAQKSGIEILTEADRQVRQRFKIDDGGEDKKPDGGKATTEPDKKPGDKGGKRRADLSVVPKTLGDLPAADISESGEDKYAYLDKLEGIELENALAKLSPEQENEYLSMRTG